MDPRSQKAVGMLDPYLHDTSAVADRLVRGEEVRDLRRSSNRSKGRVPAGSAKDKAQEKKIAVSVRKLEKNMDTTTDQELLGQAQEDQKGMSTPLKILKRSLPADISRGTRWFPLSHVDQRSRFFHRDSTHMVVGLVIRPLM